MKNIDLETFYWKYKKDIKLFSSFIGIKEMSQIITVCRLKPLNIFNTKIKNKVEYDWVDEFNKILSYKNGKVVISDKSEAVKELTQISTDLYFGRSILEIMNISKSAFILNNIICFNGIDEYLRCFGCSTLKQVSPLSIGLDNLINFIKKPYSGYKLPDKKFMNEIMKEEF